jgi:hypothetical protein
MNRQSIWGSNALITALMLLTAACGGGGGGGSSDIGDPDGSTFTLSGTVSGLTGSGLVLQNNGGDDLSIGSDGSFSFSTGLSDESSYLVTIATLPTDHNCLVGNGSGTIAGADVTDITITCTSLPSGAYAIGGSVSGLNGDGLVLQNNATDDLAISGNGEFTFTTPLEDGSSYTVSIATQPSGQTCSLVNQSGVLDGASVNNVQVSCPSGSLDAPSVTLAGPKLLRLSWNDVAVDHYRLLHNPDSVSGFSQLGENITETTVDVVIATHLTDWVNSSYMIQACSATEDCADSPAVTVNALMLEAIGYLKPSYIRAEYEFGSSVAISGDGTTLAIGAPEEDSIATGINGDPVVDDTDTAIGSGAVYLFTRDGDSWVQQAYFKASNAQAGDAFGFAVSLSDDGQTLAVGATDEDSGINGEQADNSLQRAGAVYVFTNSASGWTQQGYIKASTPVSGANFGKQVSLSASGDRLAISGGGVYLFALGGSGWAEQASVTATDSEGTDDFGISLELSGDGGTLVVGAPGEDSSSTGIDGDSDNNDTRAAGAAYVFSYNGSTWSQQAYLKAPVTDTGDEFGTDVSLSADGNTVVVTAPTEDSNATGVNGSSSNNNRENSGAVFMFERQGSVWSQSGYFKASNSAPNDKFGYKVALSGDGQTLVVSAALEDSIARGINGSQGDNSASAPPGAVYVFRDGDSGWFQLSYVKASNTDGGWEQPACFLYCNDLNDEFGRSLSISNDGMSLLVGAPWENSADATDQEDDTAPYAGAVYLY